MSEIKHTPGPWAETYLPQHRMRIFAAGGQTTICDVALWTADYDEQQANARLIAAAPDLLEALKALLPEGWGKDDTMDHMPGVRLARLAIAKAES